MHFDNKFPKKKLINKSLSLSAVLFILDKKVAKLIEIITKKPKNNHKEINNLKLKRQVQ